MKRYSLCLLILLIAAASPALAARPLVTDDLGTVDKGKFELEIGYNSTTPKTGGVTSNGLTGQIKYGIMPNFDIGIEGPHSITEPAGVGDMILHFKVKLFEAGDNDGITGRIDIKTCTGDSSCGLGSGYTDYVAMIIASKAFGDIRTHYNLGYTLVGLPAGEPEANTFNYSAATEKELVPGIDLVGEYYAVSSAAGTSSNLQAGGRWQCLDAFRIDIGYSLALNDSSDNVISAGFTAEF